MLNVVTTIIAFLKLVPDVYRVGHSIFKLWKRESIKQTKEKFQANINKAIETNDTAELEDMFNS